MLEVLVDELVLLVLDWLSADDLLPLSLVCKKLHGLAQDQTLWRLQYTRLFGMWVPPVQCQESTLLTWKLKYWLDYTQVFCKHNDLFVFGWLDCVACDFRSNASYVRYSDTSGDALVLVYNRVPPQHFNIGSLTDEEVEAGTKRGQAVAWRVRWPPASGGGGGGGGSGGDVVVGYSWEREPSDAAMVHSSLMSLYRSSDSLTSVLASYHLLRCTKPLVQLRSAAMDQVEELKLEHSVSLSVPWSELTRLLAVGPRRLRSLSIAHSLTPWRSWRLALHALTDDRRLEFLSLGEVCDAPLLDDVVTLIGTALLLLRLELLACLSDLTLIELLSAPAENQRRLKELHVTIRSQRTLDACVAAVMCVIGALSRSHSLVDVSLVLMGSTSGMDCAAAGHATDLSLLPQLLRSCGQSTQLRRVGIDGVSLTVPLKTRIEDALAQASLPAHLHFDVTAH